MPEDIEATKIPETEETKPENPGRREFLKKLTGFFGSVTYGTIFGDTIKKQFRSQERQNRGRIITKIEGTSNPNNPHFQGLDRKKGEVWKILPGEMPKDGLGNPVDLKGRPLDKSKTELPLPTGVKFSDGKNK